MRLWALLRPSPRGTHPKGIGLSMEKSQHLFYGTRTMRRSLRRTTRGEVQAALTQDTRSSSLSRASLFVSALALVTSIASPFVSFYWLQGELRIRALKAEHFAVKTRILVECDNPSKFHVTYGLQLINTGIFPIEKVKVVMEENFVIHNLPSDNERATLLKEDSALDPSAVKLTPPIEFSSEKHDDFVIVDIKDPVPPYSKFYLALATYSHLNCGDLKQLTGLGPSLWVFSEVPPPHALLPPGMTVPDEARSVFLWNKDDVVTAGDCPPMPRPYPF
jgi:hypothetical protein